jgi:DNA-binding transcriptional LysR family regulator
MDRLDAMSLLLTVVDTGSLSAAGRCLNMPLATVSRRLSDLEARLNTRLVQRTSRRLSLTDSGQVYVQACRRILEDVEQAERDAAGEYAAPKGKLIVSCYVAFGRVHVVPLCAEFLAAYPEIDLRLTLTDGVVSLLEGEADVAVRFGPLADSSLKAVRLGTIRRVFCASPQYLAARGTPATPRDLATHDCVTFLAFMQPDNWEFEGEAVRVRSRLVLNNVAATVDAAAHGVGIACVFSYLTAEAVRAGRLQILSLGAEPPALDVSLVYAAEGMLPLKLRAFLDFCVPRLKARLTAASV